MAKHTNTPTLDPLGGAVGEEERDQEITEEAASTLDSEDPIDRLYSSIISNKELSPRDRQRALTRYRQAKKADATRQRWRTGRDRVRDEMLRANKTRRFLTDRISEYRREGMPIEEARQAAERAASEAGHNVGMARRVLSGRRGSPATLVSPRGGTPTPPGVGPSPQRMGPPAPVPPQASQAPQGPAAPPMARPGGTSGPPFPGNTLDPQDPLSQALVSLLQNLGTTKVDSLISEMYKVDKPGAKFIHNFSTKVVGNAGAPAYNKLVQHDREEAARRQAQAQGGMMPV